MRIHIISIGGAVMHNLAIALHLQGHVITGSDDEIYNPSRDRLATYGLLPSEMGWHKDRITPEIDLCLLGMHARKDNPEIEAALKQQLPILSFPEFIYQHAEHKKRIVIAGSHGKTTTTSILMHILRYADKDFDYLVGAQIEGYDTMVRLSEAPIMIIEGDEYLSSALDRRPKFHHYRPHYSVITGIAWDHMNVFPTFENYCEAFATYIDSVPKGAYVFYYDKDPHLASIVKQRTDIVGASYDCFPYRTNSNGQLEMKVGNNWYPTAFTGTHNAQNALAAAKIAQEVGVSQQTIGQSFASFKGAAKRLQMVAKTKDQIAFLDFAHAPSKVRTTMHSIREQFPNKVWAAVSELHTYSSLNADFLPQYKDALAEADVACVFYSPHAVKMKRMQEIDPSDIRAGFDREDLHVAKNKKELQNFLAQYAGKGFSLLLMSSGTLGGIDIHEEATAFITTK